MNNLKITMLGTTSSGKTCFMVGMYAMMRQGVKGFTFTTEDLDDDLDLSNDWDRMVEEQGAGRWPKGTVETKPYVFEFSYGLRELSKFNWLDYRGGALRSRKDDEDVVSLLNHMQQSSSIFLCISGEHFTQSIRGRESLVMRETQIDRMIQILKKLPRAVRPSLAIVLTKFDLVAPRPKDEVVGEIKQLFNMLFASDGGWYVTICPVSLGKELNGNPDGGMIEPKCIHLPVTFAIHSAFQQERQRLQQQRQGAYNQWQSSQNSLWSKIFNQKGLESKYEAISQYDAQIAEVEKNMKLLVQELKLNSDIYYNGIRES